MSENQQQPSTAWQQQFYGMSRIQALSALVVSFFVLFWLSGIMAISVLSGGILVALNSVLLARSVVSSSQVEGVDGRGVLYRSAVVRFLLLIVVLVCANLIGLHLLAVAAGMFSAYVGGYVYIVRLTSQAADKKRD
ncbi:MAG: ATP synthase subunit I [Mariprofundaceae bacterium]